MRSKTLMIILVLSAMSCKVFSQSFIYGIYNGNGLNILDVEESEGWTLNDWGTYSNLTSLEGLFKLRDKFLLGGEIGAQRLYYWERRSPSTGYFTWGTRWTYNVGALAATSLIDEKLMLKAGAAARIYADGSGTALAVMAALDYALFSFGKFSVPLGFRSDFIMAKAPTVCLNITLGLRKNP